ALEQQVRQVLPPQRAFLAQLVDGQREEVAHPFGVKVLLHRQVVGRLLHRELAFGALEVQRQERCARRTLCTRRGFLLVGDEAVQADAQVRPKAALGGGVPREELLLEGACKKALRQIFRVFVGFAEARAKIFVDRLPVRLEQGREPALTLDEVFALRGENGRSPRGGESLPARTADVGVRRHARYMVRG